MHHSEKSCTVVPKIVLFLSLISLASVYLISGTLSPIRAQAMERVFVDKLPKHLPIKVKIKKEKEKAVKDLNNEKWPRDLELEITNTGEKPIYFVKMLLLTGVRGLEGVERGFPVQYGTIALGPVNFEARPEDVPLMPGETYVYKLADSLVESWERAQQRENRPDAKELVLIFHLLSFGDGTGFAGTTGLAMPPAPGKRSRLNRCEPEPSLSDSSGLQGQQASWRKWPTITPSNDLPASFLLANFLSTGSSQPASLNPKPQSQLCCFGNDCVQGVPSFLNCFCEPKQRTGFTPTFCSHPYGTCWTATIEYTDCGDGVCGEYTLTPVVSAIVPKVTLALARTGSLASHGATGHQIITPLSMAVRAVIL